MIDARPRRSFRQFFAAILAATLALTGAATALPAAAAPGPQVVVTPSTAIDPAEVTTITVQGTGYVGDGAANGVYIAVYEKGVWAEGAPFSSNTIPGGQAHIGLASFSDQEAGDFTGTMTIAAGVFDPSKEYIVATSAAHSLSATDRSLDTRTAITIAAPTAGEEPGEGENPGDGEEPEAPVSASLTVSKTSGLDPEGESITVTGAGYEIDPAGIYAQVGWIVEGAWTPLSQEDTRDANRKNVSSAWIGSGYPGQPAWVVAEDGTGSFTWTTTATKAQLDAIELEGGTLAVFTLGAHGNWVQPANEKFVPISFQEPVVATLSVSKTSGLDPEGETLTVTGSGYEINSGGIYAQIGWIVEGSWTPISSTETRDANRSNAGSAWIGSGYPGQPAWAVAEDGTGSFSWTVSVTKAALDAKKIEGATLAVFTLGAHGNWVQPANERFIPISFLEPVVSTLSVSKTSGLDPEGETLTVTGTGYEINPGGIYAQVGWIVEGAWTPISSTETRSTNRSNAGSAAVGSGYPGQPAWDVAEDGTGSFSWTVSVTKAALDAKKIEGATLAVFTLGSHSNWVQPANERFVPISFATGTDPETPGTGGEGEQPGTTPSAPVANGSLTWGIKASFRNYIDTIAAGNVTLAGGATTAGSAYRFVQTASSVDPLSGLGTVSYGGSVTFYGHDGALHYRFGNFRISIDSASQGTVIADFQNLGSTGAASQNGVSLVRLNLAAGAKSTTAGVTTYSSVPATALAGATSTFGSNYPVGTAFDAVTFSVGSSTVASGGTTTVGTARPAAATWTPPATPPATTGIQLEGSDEELREGDLVTITADGFQPNETDIRVVIYSTPQLLAEGLTADANGRVTWTGALPLGLTGEHTLTLQGSVSRGIVLQIAESAAATVIGECPIDGATLSWGVKESFRAYISGSAGGEWTVANGAEYSTPLFSWPQATGGFDPATGLGLISFEGDVRFTGHSGALDTTISDPQLRFEEDGTAVLLVDVIGVGRDGEAVEQQDLVFVELDLDAATVVEEDGVYRLTAVPTSLTESGVAVFSSYPAGEAFDDLDVSITLGADCLLAAASAEAGAAPSATVADGIDAPASLAWLWIVLAIILLLIVAAAVVLLRRRARTAE